jgi:hypothetical protein
LAFARSDDAAVPASSRLSDAPASLAASEGGSCQSKKPSSVARTSIRLVGEDLEGVKEGHEDNGSPATTQLLSPPHWYRRAVSLLYLADGAFQPKKPSSVARTSIRLVGEDLEGVKEGPEDNGSPATTQLLSPPLPVQTQHQRAAWTRQSPRRFPRQLADLQRGVPRAA